MNYKNFASYFIAIIVTVLLLVFPYLVFEEESETRAGRVRVLTYSSFIQSWGAGPEIAKLFEEETGLKIDWVNAGNAGLLIERLKFKNQTDKPDMIIGFDQFSIHEAKKNFKWKDLDKIANNIKNSQLPEGAQFHNFLAYDWGPLTFIYKAGELEPPKKLEDLVDDKYRGSLILQDPRMSSPGLQFFLWVLTQLGEDKGFEFLHKLKSSIKIMSPSWSSSYSIFKMEQSSMVFSYFASPFYHLIEEKDDSYKAIQFDTPHPIQVEYLGIPDFCNECEGAFKLAEFMMKPEIQKILMQKNYMYPVESSAIEGTPFSLPENVEYYRPIESLTLIKRKRELINKWKKVFY